MIRDFWVKNYLSIRDKQKLDFTAKGPASELIAEIQEGVFLYKLGILYGSNASGKSNMLFALNKVFNPLKRFATVSIMVLPPPIEETKSATALPIAQFL